MPDIQVVDANVGIPEKKAKVLISQGWYVIPKVTIGPGAIAVAGSSPRVVDIWVSPQEPMVPQAYVAGLLVTLKRNGDGDWVTLDKIARAVFGVGLKELEPHVQFNPPPTGDTEDGGRRAGGEVGAQQGDAPSQVLPFPGVSRDST